MDSTAAESDLALELSAAQRRTFRSFHELYDAVTAEHALLTQRREQARLVSVETPRRLVPIPVPVIEPHDLYEIFRSVFARHPHGITSEGIRLRGVARDEYVFEAFE